MPVLILENQWKHLKTCLWLLFAQWFKGLENITVVWEVQLLLLIN